MSFVRIFSLLWKMFLSPRTWKCIQTFYCCGNVSSYVLMGKDFGKKEILKKIWGELKRSHICIYENYVGSYLCSCFNTLWFLSQFRLMHRNYKSRCFNFSDSLKYIAGEEYMQVVCKSLHLSCPVFVHLIFSKKKSIRMFSVEFGMQIGFRVSRMEGLPTQPKTSKQTELWKVYLHLLHFLLSRVLKRENLKCEYLIWNICQQYLTNKLAKLRRHASRVHFGKVHFG